ncbi:MAG: hypothetical protein U0232_12965 [Thermomicrobiales bacterium]
MDARDLATIFRLALAELRDEVIYGTAEDACRRPLAELVPQYFPDAGDKAAQLTAPRPG